MANSKELLIEAWWDRVLPPLSNRNGTQVRDLMREVWKEDRKVWNALYWRIHVWMEGYLARSPLTEEDIRLGFSKEEVGVVRLKTFLATRIPRNKFWGPSDLPRLLSELP